MARVLVATVRPWNIHLYNQWAAKSGHATVLIQDPALLTAEVVDGFQPDFVFVPHWSWRIPAAVFERYECVAFHMADLPFGRGGSPLQNLILRGLQHTQLSAFRVVEGPVDSGPVYLKRPLCLLGSAREIYARAGELAFAMIDEIIEQRPVPVAQTGPVVEFKRRTPADSEMPPGLSLDSLFDFIRMLDADGYPPAYVKQAGFRFEFSRAALCDGQIIADVRITPAEDCKS